MTMAGPSSTYSDLELYLCALDKEFGFRLAADSMRSAPTHNFNKSDEGKCFRHLRFLWYRDLQYASHYLDDAVRWLRESICWDSRAKSIASFDRILANQESKAIREVSSRLPNKRTRSQSASDSFEALEGSKSIFPYEQSCNTSFATDASATSFNTSPKVFSFSAGGFDSTQNTSFSTTNEGSIRNPEINFDSADESLKKVRRDDDAPHISDPFWQPAVPFLFPHNSFREPVKNDLDGGDTEPATPVDSLDSTPQKRKNGEDIFPNARKIKFEGRDLPPLPLDFRFRILRNQGLFGECFLSKNRKHCHAPGPY